MIGEYRYTLKRDLPLVMFDLADRVVEPKGMVLWCMLNPSSADEDVDDPTMRRVIDFSKRWGYASLWVVNLYAQRATKPSLLSPHEAEAIGPDNDRHWLTAIDHADKVVVAWGATDRARGQARRFMALCNALGLCPLHIGENADQSPKHPLYVRATVEPRVWLGGGGVNLTESLAVNDPLWEMIHGGTGEQD